MAKRKPCRVFWFDDEAGHFKQSSFFSLDDAQAFADSLPPELPYTASFFDGCHWCMPVGLGFNVDGKKS